MNRERDELLLALRAARAGQQEAQQREWSACLQVKQVVEMAEEANLHKARVRETFKNFTVFLIFLHVVDRDLKTVCMFSCMQTEVQFEQLSRELVRHRQQIEQEAHALQERLAQAKEEGRSEAHKQKEELAHTVNLPLL